MDISIIITSYNYDDYICECIESCLLQKNTSLEFEVIVIDDGSTDQTPNILSEFSNPILKIYRIKNSGVESAANFGFERAQGDYVVRVDADDVLCPNFLSDMSGYLEEDIGFFYPDYYVINDKSEILDTVNLPEFDINEIYGRGDFLATGTIYNMGVLRKQGGYSEKIRNCGLENYELIIKLIKSGYKGKHVPGYLFKYRRHGENISAQKKQQIIEYGKELFFKEGLGNFRTNQYHPYNLKVEAV